MATEHFTAPTSLCDLFHEPELCQDEILTILQTLDDNNNNNIFNVAVSATATATPLPVLMDDKSGTTTNNNKNKRRREKPAKTASSSSPGFGSDEEYSEDDHAVLSQRKSVKRLKDSQPATSMDDVSGEDGGGNGKVVSHIAVERNRRKQMNEHLAVLRQLMPCFYVKKGDQASIIGGVIDYINELQLVLQSLEAKKQRKIYTSELGMSPRVASSPRLPLPQQLANPSPISPRKPPLSPRPLITLPISPSTPQSTSPYKPLIRQPNYIQPSPGMASPTSNSNSSACPSFADMVLIMNNSYNNNYNGVANELVTSSKSNVADVEVKFCGPNLELKTLSSKIAGQTFKMVSAIEDLSLEILQVSINTVEQTMLNTFIVKIGVECQLSAEELVQQIQQTFC